MSVVEQGVGKNTCDDAEKDHEDDASCKGGHVVKRKTVVVVVA